MCEEPELTHWVEVVRQIDVDVDVVHVALNVVLRQLRHGGSSNPKICAEILDAITDTDLAVIHWMHYLPRIMDQLQLAQHGIKCAMLKLLLRLLHTGHIKMCAENGLVIALLLEEIPCLVLEGLPMTNVITCIAGVCTGGFIWSVDWLRVVVCAHVDIYADVQHTCGPDEKLVAYGMTYVSRFCVSPRAMRILIRYVLTRCILHTHTIKCILLWMHGFTTYVTDYPKYVHSDLLLATRIISRRCEYCPATMCLILDIVTALRMRYAGWQDHMRVYGPDLLDKCSEVSRNELCDDPNLCIILQLQIHRLQQYTEVPDS